MGPRWVTLVRIRRSKLVRFALLLLRYPIQLVIQRANHPYLPINVTGTMGMGGIMVHVLKLLRHAQRNSLIPIIRVNSPLYAELPAENLLQRYLSVPERSMSNLEHLRFHQVECEQDYAALHVAKSMTLAEARATFNAFLKFNDEICLTVERLISQNGGDFILSIHYRGTDKIYDGPKAAFHEIFSACRQILEKCPAQTAFLATDEATFAESIRLEFPNITFISFEFAMQSQLGVPRHFSSLRPSQKAFEALVNMQLLSRSRYLVRTSSYLSAISCLLNEDMQVVTVGQLYDAQAFPEKQIHEAHRNRNAQARLSVP